MGIMLDENKSRLALLVLVPWCALKEGFVPLEDFSNPLKYYQHVIVALLRDCLLSFLGQKSSFV